MSIIKPNRIITHDGMFHADEVFAIAMVHTFVGPTVVFRTRNISEEDMNDPGVWVIDVGKDLNPAKRNFDHHQDGRISASCVLILDFLVQQGVIDADLEEELRSDMTAVSDIDRNGYTNGASGFQVNGLIKSLNALSNGFDTALDICCKYMAAAYLSSLKAQKSHKIWANGFSPCEKVRQCSEYPVKWKKYPDACILVYPDKGRYNVVSKDSNEYPLVNVGRPHFFHASNFFAVFDREIEAVNCAMASVGEPWVIS